MPACYIILTSLPHSNNTAAPITRGCRCAPRHHRRPQHSLPVIHISLLSSPPLNQIFHGRRAVDLSSSSSSSFHLLLQTPAQSHRLSEVVSGEGLLAACFRTCACAAHARPHKTRPAAHHRPPSPPPPPLSHYCEPALSFPRSLTLFAPAAHLPTAARTLAAACNKISAPGTSCLPFPQVASLRRQSVSPRRAPRQPA